MPQPQCQARGALFGTSRNSYWRFESSLTAKSEEHQSLTKIRRHSTILGSENHEHDVKVDR